MLINDKARARFISKTLPTGVNGCWIWTAQINAGGYGKFWIDGKSRFAHRVSYEMHIGAIPAGLHIDHLCRNRSCVNPDHLEAVTNFENHRRGQRANKTHCIKGHPLSGDNLYVSPKGWRVCKQCHRAKMREHYWRKKEASE